MYNMPYLLGACQIGQAQKKIKSLLREKFSEFIQSESPFEQHPKASYLAATQIWRFFPDTHGDLDFNAMYNQ